jgi:hypothetical protein
MQKLEDILSLWDKDSVIDRLEPGAELIRIPVLHSKYLRELTEHRATSRKINFDIIRMRKVKFEYYSGKMPEEELKTRGWEPFRYTLKSDIASYVESDPDIIRLQERKFYHEEVVSVVESIMNELKQRTWQIKSFIDFERFANGA